MRFPVLIRIAGWVEAVSKARLEIQGTSAAEIKVSAPRLGRLGNLEALSPK